VLAAIVVLRGCWLPHVGTVLESSCSPVKADIAVVLSGDYFGNRILRGAQLVHDGFVPKVLVSGPSGMYGHYDSELAIAFAVKNGYPDSIFVPSPNDARSTREEALAIVPELRRMGVKRVLLVTSDYHTRRAGRTFRAAAPELQIAAVSSPDADFQLDRWWLTREGRKYVVMEWFKTVAERVGL
jgi:uncharacterized SAM-binding protein YcdF (DUF218 family)